ncbi:hypothetical protein Q6U52_000896 [Vibrio alginolyticus]|nr:hypothetical protein [Vibrio alginolyticus]
MSSNDLPMFTDLEEVIKLDYKFYTQLINDGLEPVEAFLTATIDYLYKDIDLKPKELHRLIERLSTSGYLHQLEKKKSLEDFSDVDLRAELFVRNIESGFDVFDLEDDEEEELEANPIDEYVVEVATMEHENEGTVGVSDLDMTWCVEPEDDEINLVEDEDGNLTRPDY